MPTITCPKCHKSFEVPENKIDSVIQCSYCGFSFTADQDQMPCLDNSATPDDKAICKDDNKHLEKKHYNPQAANKFYTWITILGSIIFLLAVIVESCEKTKKMNEEANKRLNEGVHNLEGTYRPMEKSEELQRTLNQHRQKKMDQEADSPERSRDKTESKLNEHSQSSQ